LNQRIKLREHYRQKVEPEVDKSSEEILSMDEKFLRKAREIIEKNLFDSDYSVERFASDMALSRVQLHRKLKALVDQSVTEFIRTIRLNHALVLLQKKAGTIAEIAYDSGFSNPSYFSASFKEKFGISPTEYIEKLNRK
jgi:AraC-like DNA-binding protein